MFDAELVLSREISREAHHSQSHANKTTTHQNIAISCPVREASVSRMNNLHLVTTYLPLETHCGQGNPLKAYNAQKTVNHHTRDTTACINSATVSIRKDFLLDQMSVSGSSRSGESQDRYLSEGDTNKSQNLQFNTMEPCSLELTESSLEGEKLG